MPRGVPNYEIAPEIPLELLGRFSAPLQWEAIERLRSPSRGELRYRSGWWRRAIIAAENDGLLTWDNAARGWKLTEKGRNRVVHAGGTLP